MSDYKELANRMAEGTIVKAVIGDYVIYRRDWLRDNIEQEYVLQKKLAIFKPDKDGITRLREFLKKQEGAKDGKGF